MKNYLISFVSILLLTAFTMQSQATIPPPDEILPGGYTVDYVNITSMINISYKSWEFIDVSVDPIGEGSVTTTRVGNSIIKVSVKGADTGTFWYDIRVHLKVDGVIREFRSVESFYYKEAKEDYGDE